MRTHAKALDQATGDAAGARQRYIAGILDGLRLVLNTSICLCLPLKSRSLFGAELDDVADELCAGNCAVIVRVFDHGIPTRDIDSSQCFTDWAERVSSMCFTDWDWYGFTDWFFVFWVASM